MRGAKQRAEKAQILAMSKARRRRGGAWKRSCLCSNVASLLAPVLSGSMEGYYPYCNNMLAHLFLKNFCVSSSLSGDVMIYVGMSLSFGHLGIKKSKRVLFFITGKVPLGPGKPKRVPAPPAIMQAATLRVLVVVVVSVVLSSGVGNG